MEGGSGFTGSQRLGSYRMPMTGWGKVCLLPEFHWGRTGRVAGDSRLLSAGGHRTSHPQPMRLAWGVTFARRPRAWRQFSQRSRSPDSERERMRCLGKAMLQHHCIIFGGLCPEVPGSVQGQVPNYLVVGYCLRASTSFTLQFLKLVTYQRFNRHSLPISN